MSPARAELLQALARIDWAAPWLAPLATTGLAVAAEVAAGASLAEALNRRAVPPGPAVDLAWPQRKGLALPATPLPRFEPAAPPRREPRPAGAAVDLAEPYEARIARTAHVPTRDGLHDFFNGLVWRLHGALKWRLNALHAQVLASEGAGPRRGALRDALTRFDEFGAVLRAPAPLVEALRARDWQALFIDHRDRWREARLDIVGHGLLEQLSTVPRKALTAHVLVADPMLLEADDWSGRPFLPLPVLGVPGWSPANEAAGFYDDVAVFRPPPAALRHGAQSPCPPQVAH